MSLSEHTIAAAYALAMTAGLPPAVAHLAFHRSKDELEFYNRVEALVWLDKVVRNHYGHRP